MEELPYNKLPELPELPKELSSCNVIARFVDALGFRYRWATEGLNDENLNFKPADSSMDMEALLKHLYDLVYMSNSVFGGSIEKKQNLNSIEEYRKSTLELIADLGYRLKQMNDSELNEFKFTRKNGAEFSVWYMFNGPLADALTHVGQITAWRRINGNPQPKGVNVFLGTKE
jgi:hypothetical protein